MAAGTDYVVTEGSIGPVRREVVTVSAIHAESRAGIDPRMGIHMLLVGKVIDNRPHVFVARERTQIIAAGWRKYRMALNADLLIQGLIEVVVMTRRALIVPGPLKNHGAVFYRHVAGVAIQSHLI